MQLSHDQKKALKQLILWLKNPLRKRYITLGGYAGTGKTTLISILRKLIQDKTKKPLSVAFCSYTGRAVQVLKNSLEKNKALYPQDTVSTIHSLIYSPVINAREEIIGWDRQDSIDANLIIVDEASMVNEIIWNDLLSYNIPIIAIGDHGQLAPIEGKFNLMEKPDITLTEIHRQMKGNPIIEVSIHARQTGNIPIQNYADTVIKYNSNDFDTQPMLEEMFESYEPDTIILCGYNSTRNRINQFIRNSLGFEFIEPQVGDRVICQRNNHKKRIYNGMLGTIVYIENANEDWFLAEIRMDDTKEPYKGLVFKKQFGAPNPTNFTKDRKLTKKGDLFDFGYALTVHKSQGSQARKVILFEERFKQMNDEEWRRWLYTGVTRAQEELYLIGQNDVE